MKDLKITFVTGNKHKAFEAAGILNGLATVEHISMECPEIRSLSVEEVAKGKALYAFSMLKRPVIADDTGFFIPTLNCFPGACAAFVQDTIGNEGILCLMANKTDRSAYFETGIAYADESGVYVFSGRINGSIVNPKGNNGFGYDPIFSVNGKTLAEMNAEEKNAISHRSIAIRAFRAWLVDKHRS